MKTQSGILIFIGGIQEVNSSQNSPMISGKTVFVSDTDADNDHGETFDADGFVYILCAMCREGGFLIQYF